MVYCCDDRFFFSGIIESVEEKDEDHWIFLVRDDKYRIPVRFLNNRFCKVLDHAKHANLRPGCAIYIKISRKNNVYFANQFIFYGQMRLMGRDLEERNLYVGKITKVFSLSRNIVCMQMPINEKGGKTKWINLLYHGNIDIEYLKKRLGPSIKNGKKVYKTAAFVTGKETIYRGFYQADIL